MTKYEEMAREYGEYEFNGNAYALTSYAERTNRLFPGWWGDAEEGEEYVDEWGASAIDEAGEEYEVVFQFDRVKGDEEEADGLPWDDEHIVQVFAL